MAMGPGMGMMGAHRGFMSEDEKAAVPRVTLALLKRILSYLKPYWKQLLLVLVAILLSSFFTLLPSILTGKIIDDGLISKDMNALLFYVILSLAVIVVANLIGVGESFLNNWIAQHITYDMRNSMYNHLQHMSHRFFTTNNQGDIVTRMTSDIAGVEMVITNTFTSILSNSLTLLIALIAMFEKNPLLAAIGIIIIPLFALPTRKAGKTRWSLTKEAQDCNDEINGILNETLSVSGQLLVKLFCQEEKEFDKYQKSNKRIMGLTIKEKMAGRWFFVFISTFSSVGPLLLYLVGGILIMKHDSTLSVGDITVLVALLGRMYGPVNHLLNIQVDWMRAMALFSRIFEYFDMPLEIKNPENPVVIKTKPTGQVKFSNVNFYYNKERQILKNISFELKTGDCIAVVGPSGSGKSTLVNLIPRLYDVISGEVLFDGVDVRNLDLSYLRKNIGVVTQESYLFNGTIADNLLYAKPDATRAQLIAACKKAHIYDFIKAQKDGFDTEVGNRGLKLSGGEKQRLSIARVLLKDPALLIFDEATSALDSISEQKIQEAIEPLIESRTSILIAHRLSTILAADEIIVLQDGSIVERGEHKKLIKENGIYSQLYETQFKKSTVKK